MYDFIIIIISFYSASPQLAIQTAVLAVTNLTICLSICMSVHQTVVLCQNDSSYDLAIFTGG